MFKSLFHSWHLVLLVVSLFVTSCVSNPMQRGTHYRNTTRSGGTGVGGQQCMIMLSPGVDVHYFDEENIVPPIRSVCLQFSSNSLTISIQDSDSSGVGGLEYQLNASRAGGCVYEDEYVELSIVHAIHDMSTLVLFSFHGDSVSYELGKISDSQRLPISCQSA